MALNVIRGGSGSGKSTWLYEYVIENAVKNPEINYLIIVPEQYTMSTQRRLVKLHPRHSLMNIDILSFQRLAIRVFSQLGIDSLPVLDDTGKNLIIRKIMEDNRSEFKSFGKNIDKNGFSLEIKSIISEMLQYAISPDKLHNVNETLLDNPSLIYKISDIEFIYKTFMEYIKKDYITAEELLTVLARNVSKSDLIKNSVVALDGFTGFTPVQYNLIENMLPFIKDILVTVTIDDKEPYNIIEGKDNLFSLSKETIYKLSKIADLCQIKINPHIVCSDNYRFKAAKDMAFLEKNIFRYKRNRFNEKAEHIHIYCGENPKEEIRNIACEIIKLTKENSYRYKDIAVVLSDLEIYANLCANIFSQNEIPYFLDYKRQIMTNPAIEFIRSALLTVENNYAYENIFAMLRTGFSDLSDYDIDLAENYCLALGIRGHKKWYNPWKGNFRSKNAKKVELDKINEIRESILKALEPFERLKELKKNNKYKVKDLIETLYEFMVNANIEDKITEIADKLDAQQEVALAMEYSQIYGKIIELIDKIYALLGEEYISFIEFTKIFDSGLEEIKLGVIPPSADCILVGDIQRTRLDDVKIVFFAGVNDGLVPKKEDSYGILTELDRSALEKANITLAPNAKEKSFIEQFYLYQNITKPSKHLYLSYAALDMDGKSKRPSYVLQAFLRMFLELKIDSDNVLVDRYLVIPKKNFEWKENEFEAVAANVARAIYSDEANQSITRLEKFAACEFAHFIEYGLRLSEREEYSIGYNDEGTVLHTALERISLRIKAQGLKYNELSDKDRKEFVDKIVEDTVAQFGNELFSDSKRNEYLVERIKKLTDRTLWAMGKQLDEKDFMPSEFEYKFHLPMNVEKNGINVNLVGSIDRIDLYEDQENVYVRVVDYKSGNSKFELYKIYYGLKLQLMTYMEVALSHIRQKYPDKNVLPAGAFYYKIANPFVDKVSDIQQVEASIYKELQLKGISSSDLPEELTEGKTQASNTQFTNLFSHLEDIRADYVKKMYDGDAKIVPYEEENYMACDYCGYRAVCGFYSDLPGCKTKRVDKLKDDEVWKMIWDEKGDKKDGESVD